MSDSTRERMQMVQTQIADRGIRDESVLGAMRTVPRERFVDVRLAESAYADSPLPIGAGQTISQPYIVAAMVEAAEIGPADRVLEVGAGSGYAAAVMGLIAANVYAIERHPALAAQARERIVALGYRNVEIRCGDGSLGWPDAAPFDAIVIAAGGPEVPPALKRQLVIGGRLVMPIGGTTFQRLVMLRRTGEAQFAQRTLADVAFVPLIGEQGWSAGEA